MKRIKRIIILFSGIICVLFIVQFQQQITFAQTGEISTWFPPVNLSKSGGVANPHLIVDPNDIFHVIWEDEFAGFVYSFGDGLTWNEPQAIELPFSQINTSFYKFAVDSKDRMHALWINEDGELFYSRSAIEDFSINSGWLAAQRMARSTIYFDIITDENSNVHLAYLRGESSLDGVPAGIYYQNIFDGNLNWSDPVAIEQSPYLRTIPSEDANINIAITPNNDLTTIYLTWDNPAKRQVFLTQSNDTGVSWNDPIVIGNPPDVFTIPQKIKIQAFEDQAMIIWNLSENETDCSQQFIWTTDNGSTWENPRLLFDKQNGCPEISYLFGTEEGFLLFYISNEQGFMQFWNGSEWSLPQQQLDFDNLSDPETNLFLKLRSLQANFESGTLYVIGSDSINTNDIWSTGKKIGEVQSWFPQPSGWTKPEEIVQEYNQIGSTQLIADSTGRLHAFWNQSTSNDYSYPFGEIYYSVWDGSIWSPSSVIFRSPSNRAYLYNIAITSDDVIYVVWNSGNEDGLIVSWANANTAYNPGDWLISNPLPTPQWYATSPDICINEDDDIFITYVLPINEDRGIYLAESSDGGYTWDRNIQIIDAASEKWAMVDNSQISSCANKMEVIWTTYTLPPDPIPVTLYATNSIDGGIEWSGIEEIVESNVIWSDVIQTSDKNIHRFWEENERGVGFVWHQHSLNQGNTWNSPENILSTNDSIDAIYTLLDSSNQLHLFFSTTNTTYNTIVHHWQWDNDHWDVNDSLNLGKESLIQPESLSATITSEGLLGVIFSARNLEPTSEETKYFIDFSRREIDIQDKNEITTTLTLTSEPTLTPTIPTPTPLSEINPTATSKFSDESGTTSQTNTWSGLIAGGVIGFLILILILVTGFVVRYRKR